MAYFDTTAGSVAKPSVLIIEYNGLSSGSYQGYRGIYGYYSGTSISIDYR